MGLRELCSGWANAGWHGLPFPGQEHRKAAAQAPGVCSDRLLGRPFLPVRAILPCLMDWMVHARLACRTLAPLAGLVRNAVSSINVDSPRRGWVYRLGSKCSIVGRVGKKKSGACQEIRRGAFWRSQDSGRVPREFRSEAGEAYATTRALSNPIRGEFRKHLLAALEGTTQSGREAFRRLRPSSRSWIICSRENPACPRAICQFVAETFSPFFSKFLNAVPSLPSVRKPV